ncbi:MAG: serine/threonine-protein kinase, partial [Verrucomicrobiota bacterium]
MSDPDPSQTPNPSSDPDAWNGVDPEAPTEFDPAAAFRMGAETSNTFDITGWLPPAPEEIDPLFPDHEIQGLLGRGGMGAVYKGLQKSLDRAVAIKVLPPEMAEADPSFAARFEREAKAMARLEHANIVTIYDFGQTEAGHYYIVMEFVDGMDFHQLIHSNQLDAQGALNAVSQICDALDYAHEEGFVHRDIKPANIFINQKGIVKVGDFGLAKIVTGEGETEVAPNEPLVTMSGISLGTPVYAAPEQMDGRPIDHRADIYSLGVMFYEMLTRELPRGHFPPPSKKVEVDVRLDEVVLKAMESEPEQRYRNATEMRTAVDMVRTSEPVPAGREQGETGSSRRRLVVFGSAILALVAIGFGVWSMKERFASDSSDPTSPGDVAAVSATSPADEENIELAPRIEPSKPTGEGQTAPVQGRLRAWSQTNEVPIDLSRAEGINDFVQVIAVQYPSEWEDETCKGGWAALRSNGRIISSNGLGEDLENVTRLIQRRHSFGAVLADRSVVSFGHGKEVFQWQAPEGKEVVEASLDFGHSLAVLEDGKLCFWGRKYEEGSPDEKWPPPPSEALSEPIQSIGVTGRYAFALTREGSLFVWGKGGVIPVPEALKSNLEEAAALDSWELTVRQNGNFRLWDLEKGKINNAPFFDVFKATGLRFGPAGVLVTGESVNRRLYLREGTPQAGFAVG